jgi:hypothetical protein
VILFLGFGDAYLLRAYMPVWITVLLFAAVGLAACAAWIGARLGHLAASVLVALVLAGLALASWTTLFGRVENPLFVQRFYVRAGHGDRDHRDVDRPILERLRTELREGEQVGVFGDKAAIFRLQDEGIRARENYLEGAPEGWPEWIVGVRKGRDGFDSSPHASTNGGAYELVVSDAIGRWGLYRRVR